jgi:hypothetical protein
VVPGDIKLLPVKIKHGQDEMSFRQSTLCPDGFQEGRFNIGNHSLIKKGLQITIV